MHKQGGVLAFWLCTLRIFGYFAILRCFSSLWDFVYVYSLTVYSRSSTVSTFFSFSLWTPGMSYLDCSNTSFSLWTPAVWFQLFNNEFFSIRQRTEESLPALAARVEESMLRIKDLRSSSFDIATLDDELTCMAMIWALGPEYFHFTSSLALLTDLDKDKGKAAFQTEEINRRPRSDAIPTPSADSALSVKQLESHSWSSQWETGIRTV